MDNSTHYLEIPALRVKQPLGDFYIIKINAKKLLDLSFSEPMEYTDEFGNVKGSQRKKDEKRLKEIAKYIDSVEMAFPNSIILAANYTQKGIVSKDETERWQIIQDEKCDIYKIRIPKNIRMAAIIDGQHRLNAFEYVENPERLSDLELICSVYFDLPNSYQAFLFATINSNQKKVDRSLALEQFGYNVGEENEKSWTPEKFGVFLSRKLNIDKETSPFYKHIKVAPLRADNLFKDGTVSSWVVSTATIVDGITCLISSNPKRDRIDMQQKSIFSGRERDMIKDTKDFSPLRKLFIDGKDQTIYNTVINYFTAINQNLWINSDEKSYIHKTVGIQASFDILKLILNIEKSENPDNIDFNGYLSKLSSIDFSDKFFQASGIGRSRIKNTIATAIGLITKEKLKKVDLPFYDTILIGKNTNISPEKWAWDDEAETAIVNTLDKAEWNYNTKTITLYLDNDYENSKKYSDYNTLFQKLVEIAEQSFANNLPADTEFADEQKEKFDSEDLVRSCLLEYESNLKLLGWISI